MPSFYVCSNNSRKPVDLPEGAEVELGREPASAASVSINDPSVSRRHALVSVRGGRLYITDLGSTNGTWMGGKRLEPNCAEPVTGPVMLGNGNISLEPDTGKNQQPAETPRPVRPAASESTGKSLDAWLKEKSEIFLGRSPECDIVLADNSVSRRHARVFRGKDGIWVEDLNSTNGTYLNGKRLKGKARIGAEDTLYVGLNAFRLGSGRVDLSRESAITAVQVSKVYKNGHVGLQPLSISIPGREMVALMGPSGCGKSTLLKILNGDNPATGGQVFLFGLELLGNYELLKQKIGYVPQDDIVHPELSVDDTLYYAAKLRLGADAGEEDIAERMEEVLTSLNINDPGIRRNKVGSLSGGQRKRVSIAVELLNRPSILFLDEPTSPLDPETIEEFLKCLRRLCQQGTTVVMVTHKPEDLNYVDRLIFLGSRGYHVYDGNKDQFLGHFGKQHIVEVYSLLNSESSSKDWYRRWYKQDRSPDITRTSGLKKDRDVNPFGQLYWLMRRYMHIKVSNVRNLVLLLIQPVLIAVLILLVFDDLIVNNADPAKIRVSPGVLFMMSVAAVWFGVSNSAKEIVGEKAIFRRERMFNLKLGPYLLSKWLVLSFISLIQLFIFTGILKAGYGDQLEAFFPSTLFLLAVAASAILFGLLLSSLSDSTEEVMSILPVALMPQIILAGMVAALDQVFTELLSYGTLGRWGTEGLARIQDNYTDGPFTRVMEQNLYGDGLIKAFNSFEYNLLALGMLDLVMMVAIVVFLVRTEKQQS